MEAFLSWPQWPIALTGFFTLVAAFLGSYVSAAAQRASKKEEKTQAAQYLAIRLVCVLDQYAEGCRDVTYDQGSPDSDGHYLDRVDDPSLALPTDGDWRTLKLDLLYRALSLPNAISSALEAIRWTHQEIASPPDFDEYFVERRKQYATLGIKASTLAADLRKEYGIAKNADSSHDARFKTVLEEIDALEKAAQKRHAAFLEKVG